MITHENGPTSNCFNIRSIFVVVKISLTSLRAKNFCEILAIYNEEYKHFFSDQNYEPDVGEYFVQPLLIRTRQTDGGRCNLVLRDQ